MSCDVSTSPLCKNIFWLLEILSSTSTFQIWSSRYFCTTTYLKISLKILPSVWRCQQMHMIQLYAKTHWYSLKYLCESTSSSFCSSLVICTATLFYFALVTPNFFLLVVLPTKPLSPGEWTHWRILSACNETFFFLSKTEVLQSLHQQVSGFAQMILPSSPTSRETLIWSFWPLQELPRCAQHSVEHLECMGRFGMVFSLHCVPNPLTQ